MMCSGSVYFQFVQIPHKENSIFILYNKGAVREEQKNILPRCHAGNENRASPAETGRRGPFKKHCPLLMRGNSQGSGQTTNHLLTAAKCFGSSHTQPAPLSPPFHGAGCFCSVPAAISAAGGYPISAFSSDSFNLGREETGSIIFSIRYKTRAGLWSFFAARSHNAACKGENPVLFCRKRSAAHGR